MRLNVGELNDIKTNAVLFIPSIQTQKPTFLKMRTYVLSTVVLLGVLVSGHHVSAGPMDIDMLLRGKHGDSCDPALGQQLISFGSRFNELWVRQIHGDTDQTQGFYELQESLQSFLGSVAESGTRLCNPAEQLVCGSSGTCECGNALVEALVGMDVKLEYDLEDVR